MKCLVILYVWFLVFLLSIWLNDQVQQEYGVAQKSTIVSFIQKLCNFIKGKKKNGEELGDSEFEIEMKS